MMTSASPYRFIYFFLVISAFLFAIPGIHAQVNQSELENLGPVEFINYEGPYSRIETRAQIRSIGYSLGQAVKDGTARPGGTGRYFIIHSVSGVDGSKLDADIMGLGADVGVDHIRNLRLIVQGYLEAAYEYTERDAALLAEYITIYNAVYRGDLSYFNSRYKTPVINNLSQEKTGLALRYDEWPGQTLMVIPLGNGRGGLSTVDTSSIGDSRVIEQLRQEPGMGIDQRKDMVDLLEREADQASQQAAITREAIQQEEQRIARERQQAQQQQEQARREQERSAREKQEAQTAAEQRTLEQREQEAQAQQQEAQKRLDELARQQEAIDERKQSAEQMETFAEQKGAEAQQGRQQIAEDQQTAMSREPPPALPEGVLGVSILNNDSALGRLVLLDNANSEVKQSPLNTVNARTVTLLGNRIFAVAGSNRGNEAIRLVEISPSTLEMQKQGNDDIAAGSLLWVNGQDLYAIIGSGNNLNLARFNMDLALQTRSSISVHPFASVLFSNGLILTQRGNGSATMLDPVSLGEKR